MKDKKQTVKIEPTDGASLRTKNRIRERGPTFQVERHHLNGRTWLMRQAVGDGRVALDGEIWLGWLPVDEFRVIEKAEN